MPGPIPIIQNTRAKGGLDGVPEALQPVDDGDEDVFPRPGSGAFAVDVGA